MLKFWRTFEYLSKRNLRFCCTQYKVKKTVSAMKVFVFMCLLCVCLFGGVRCQFFYSTSDSQHMILRQRDSRLHTPLCLSFYVHAQTHIHARIRAHAQWVTAWAPCDRPAASTCSQQAWGQWEVEETEGGVKSVTRGQTGDGCRDGRDTKGLADRWMNGRVKPVWL